MVHVSCLCYHFTSLYSVEVVLGALLGISLARIVGIAGLVLVSHCVAMGGGWRGSCPCGEGRLELHVGYEEAYGIAGGVVYLYRVEVHKGVRL